MGTSLEVQWLRLYTVNAVQYLVGELRLHMPWPKKKKKKVNGNRQGISRGLGIEILSISTCHWLKQITWPNAKLRGGEIYFAMMRPYQR